MFRITMKFILLYILFFVTYSFLYCITLNKNKDLIIIEQELNMEIHRKTLKLQSMIDKLPSNKYINNITQYSIIPKKKQTI